MAEIYLHNVRFYKFEPKAIHCISYDKDSKLLALSRSDGDIEIWSCIANPFKQHTIYGEKDGSVEALAWCGGRLFSAGLQGFIYEYCLKTLDVLCQVAVTGGPTWCLALSPDKTKLAAGTERNCICIFEVKEDGLIFDKLLNQQEGRILCLSWHADGDLLATGSSDYVTVWSYRQEQMLKRFSAGRERTNQETIIWCIAILPDKTIVTGDSRGLTAFWHIQTGTMLTSVLTHKADVLSLQVCGEGNIVFVAGVDPTIVVITKVPAESEDGVPVHWVKTAHRSIHTHDVRALALTQDDRLFSGGVDTDLIQSYAPPKTVIKYPATPHHGFASVARESDLLLLQNTNDLTLWKLGKPASNSGDSDNSAMPLSEAQVKLLQIEGPKRARLQGCAISPKGSWISYIAGGELRLLHFSISKIRSKGCLEKVYMGHGIEPSKHLLWIDETMLASATKVGTVQMIGVAGRTTVLHKSFTLPGKNVANLMSASPDGRWLVVSDSLGTITAFEVATGKCLTIPKHHYPVTAVAVSSADLVIAAHSDMRVIEYSLRDNNYSKFFRSFLKNQPSWWQDSMSVIHSMSYHPDKSELVFFNSLLNLIVMDKSPFHSDKEVSQPRKKAKTDLITGPITKKNKIYNIIARSNHVLYHTTLRKSCALSIEINPVQVLDSLPAALKVKKYGAG